MSESDRIPSTFTPWWARNVFFAAIFGWLSPRFSANFLISPLSGRTLGVECKQLPLGDQQIRQPKERVELRSVLRQSLVAYLLHAEEVLDDVKRVLDLGTHACLELLDLVDQPAHRRLRQRLAFARTHRDFPSNLAVAVLLPLLDALVARIAKGHFLFSMQQGMGLGDIIGVGRGGHQRVGDAGFGIDANVGFHAKVPLIALLGLMHFRIPLAASVLGRGRCGDDRGINDRAFLEDQTLLRQHGIDGSKDALGQMVLFQQAAKLEQGGGIGRRLPRQVDANEAPDGLAVVDGVFDPFIGQSEALLGNIHAQHAFHAKRRPASSGSLRVERFDLGHQRRPRRYRVDFGKKPVTPRHFLLARIFKFGKARLHRQVPIKCQYFNCRMSGMSSAHRSANKSVCP